MPKNSYRISEELIVELNALLKVNISELDLSLHYDSIELIKLIILREVDDVIRNLSLGIYPISYSSKVLSTNVVSTRNTDDLDVK